jgi:hypothetical protein
MSSPAKIPVCVVQGDTWAWSFNWADSDANTDLADLAIEILVADSYDGTNAMTLVPGSGIVVTEADGLIQVDKVIDIDPGEYVWSLRIGNRVRIRADFIVLKKVPSA